MTNLKTAIKAIKYSKPQWRSVNIADRK